MIWVIAGLWVALILLGVLWMQNATRT